MNGSHSSVLLIWFAVFFIFQTVLISASLKEVFQNPESTRHKRHIGEELMYTSSKIFPRTLSVLNSSAQIGVVVDAANEKVAILNGETGRGIVIDKPLRMGVVVERDGWLNIQTSLKDYLRNCDVASLMERNSDNSFQLDDQDSSSEATKLIESNLVYFGEDLASRVLQAGGNLINLTLDLFSMVMHPLKNVLGPVINIAMEGWVVIKGGILALLNVFYWMGKLVSYVAGGFVRLVAKAVRFPLTIIVTALDGARAFFHMLKELTVNFDLIEILRTVLTVPAEIARFIAGLGGELAEGITGVFTIFAKIFEFAASGVIFAIQGFVDILLRFFGGQRPNYREVQRSASELLTIADDQERRYNNDFRPYKDFLGSVAGTNDYNIKGVGVGSLVHLLTNTFSTQKSSVMGVFDVLRPLIPFGSFIPQMLGGMVRMLDTPDGPSYIQRILPSVRITQGDVEDCKNTLFGATSRTAYVGQSLRDLKLLPAPAILRQLPVIGAIYRELDEAVRSYNTTLDAILENEQTHSDKNA